MIGSTASSVDPIVPFRFYANREKNMLEQMVALKRRSGLRRFLLTAPNIGVRLTGFPDPHVYRAFAETLLQVKIQLEAENIEVGWWCAPSLKSGKGPYQNITGLDGRFSETSSCPLDLSFREVFSHNVATVAQIARPFLIQFEDDFELSSHSGVSLGCFCPLHLAEFGKRQGRFYTREELQSKFSQVTTESIALRRAWAELSRDSLVSFAHLIRQKVDKITPETRIALCQSGVADVDGDFTEAVARAFAGKTRPAVRVYGSAYSSDQAQDIPGTIFHALYSRQHLPKDFELFHESDSYPHTRFFMSSAKLKSLMTAAFAYGIDDSLFYTTQYLDEPLEEGGYDAMFRRESRRFEALKAAVKECETQGCEIMYRPYEHTAMAYGQKRGHYAWANLTGRLGIPHTSSQGKVKLVSGATVEVLTDDEVYSLLKGSVFLDGKAAYYLSKRGFDNLIGAEVSVGGATDFCYEGIRTNIATPSGSLMYNFIFAPAGTEGGGFYRLEASASAEIVTDFLDPEELPVLPGMLRFENEIGGRVAITAFDLQGNNSSAIFNYRKKEVIRQTIEWLGREPLPAFVTHGPNVFCIYSKSKTNTYAIVTLINLCADTFDSITLETSPEWTHSNVETLNTDGQWRPANTERNLNTIKIAMSFSLMTPVILKLTNQSATPKSMHM